MPSDLVLFRHGKAVRPSEAPDDHARRLTDRGRIESRAQAERLRAAGFVCDVALISTAARAVETWDEAAPAFPLAEARRSRGLYLASPDVYLAAAREAGASRVMIVAHDPGLHELARTFMRGAVDGDAGGGVGDLRDDLPTAGVAWFVADATTRSGWRLNAYLRPARAL